MNSREETLYRLRLARGHLESAEKLCSASLWSESANSSQLSVENSAKAVIALFRPIVKAHELATALLDLEDKFQMEDERFGLEKLASFAQRLGLKEHILASYGDEVAYKTPWEIYDEDKAQRALSMAQAAFQIAQSLCGKQVAAHDQALPQ